MKQVDADDEKVGLAQEVIRKMIQMGASDSRTLSQALKQTFDKKYGTNWNCVIGNCFGSNVSHLNSNFMYFFADNQAVLLFKTPSN
ncbi:Dynein light chain [Aphelenchoides bicaudatus]|nr:Dynein light chain [Aphelenchoides bicaudatus]